MAGEKADKAEEGKKGGGIMSVLPLAVIAAAGTFGMVWYAAAPAPTVAAACETEHAADIVPPEELEARAANYLKLEPILVTLGPEAGARHLKIEVVLGTPSDIEALTEVEHLRLRDQFLERLRLVDTSVLTDPAAMPALKDELLVQARSTLGADAVYSVLITDFLMK
jgi:flagellar FliL protein